VPHIGSKHRHTFYPAAICGLVTRWLKAQEKEQEEPAVKHTAFGKFLPAAK